MVAKRLLHALAWPLGVARPPRPRVLLYHGVDDSGSPISVSTDLFARQMRWLREHGYVAWPASVYVQALAQRTPIPRRVVVITFDDGYRNTLEKALPELEKNGLCATAFVVTGNAGEPPRWERRDQARIDALLRRVWRNANAAEREGIAASLRASLREPLATLDEWQKAQQRGFEVGSHTETHVFCDQEPAATVRREIETAARELSARGCGAARLLAWPYGQTSPEAAAVARECGVAAAFVAEWSWPRRHDGDLMRLNRVPVDARLGVFGLAFTLGWGFELWMALRGLTARAR